MLRLKDLPIPQWLFLLRAILPKPSWPHLVPLDWSRMKNFRFELKEEEIGKVLVPWVLDKPVIFPILGAISDNHDGVIQIIWTAVRLKVDSAFVKRKGFVVGINTCVRGLKVRDRCQGRMMHARFPSKYLPTATGPIVATAAFNAFSSTGKLT